jgi:hypothetical protein
MNRVLKGSLFTLVTTFVFFVVRPNPSNHKGEIRITQSAQSKKKYIKLIV